MKFYELEEFTNGWFIGNFQPSIFKNSSFEVAIKSYKKGDKEPTHKQILATELTVVLSGKILLGGQILQSGQILQIDPGEFANFEALLDSLLVCVKYPSIPSDKVLA